MDQAMDRIDWDAQFGIARTEFDRLLARSGAASSVILETSGNCVTYFGEEPEFDLAAFASLAVGDYLATQEIATLLGEDSLQWVVHQGRTRGLILVPLGPLLLIAILFDGRTTLGLVRHQLRKDWGRLERALAPIADLLERQIQEGAFNVEPYDQLGGELEGLAEGPIDEARLRDDIERLFGPSA